MNPRARTIVGGTGSLGVGLLMLWGMLGLPAFGDTSSPYGALLSAAAPGERSVQNVVSAVNFDYRAIDTLGEEYILFAAVAATALLLRRLRWEDEKQAAIWERLSGGALHVWGIAMTGITLLFGLYIVVHATVSPGGGFQGGCILASAWLVVFLTGDLRLIGRVTNRKVVQFSEAAGAGAYAAIGFSTVLAGGAFLQNMLPLGSWGSVLSGGTIVLINAAVGLEVTAGFVLILLEFLRQTEELEGGD